MRNKLGVVAVMLALLVAVPALASDLTDQVQAATDLAKAGKLTEAEVAFQKALTLATTTGLDKLEGNDLLAVAAIHQYIMAIVCDRAIRQGKLEDDNLAWARYQRRQVLGVRNMKVIGQGERIDLAAQLAPGKINLVDFYSEFCGPCMAIAPALEALADMRDDLFLVKVDINRPGQQGIDWSSPVAQQFGLESIPHMRIYGPDGKLQAEGQAAHGKVMKWLQDAGLLSGE